MASVIEFRLVSDADKKFRGRGIGSVASHGERAIAMLEAGVPCAFERDGRTYGGFGIMLRAPLDHLDFDFVVRLIIRIETDGAIKRGPVVTTRVHVVEKVSRADGGVCGIDFENDVAKLRVQADLGRSLRTLGWRKNASREEKGEPDRKSDTHEHLNNRQEAKMDRSFNSQHSAQSTIAISWLRIVVVPFACS